MCGRYQLDVPFNRLVELYGPFEKEMSGMYTTHLNIAPTQSVPVVLPGARLSVMRWGFPATWLTREGQNPWSGRPLFNARSESARTKMTWKQSLLERRCLLPCTGFYEWIRQQGKRLPIWFRPARTDVLSMAGIWREFDKDGERISCVSILTIEANSRVAPIHDRMPVFIPVHARDAWLDHRFIPDFPSYFRSAPDGILDVHPVSTRLGQTRATDSGVLIADWALDPGFE